MRFTLQMLRQKKYIRTWKAIKHIKMENYVSEIKFEDIYEYRR